MNVQKGQALWAKAKGVIPGGVQLLSKNPEQFLPGSWPSYFSRARGIEVVDIDGNRFLDFSIMGIGSCALGYADPDVNRAVKEAVDTGNMCTLNSPEEVELAELLLGMHPWAGKVRYSRTGGEAMAIAVRLARAYSGREKIAFCGYHGWHDWYLSANLSGDSNLDGHLLPGLKPLGVPRVLTGTAFPFRYNRIEELESLVKGNDIGVIVMEPVRNYYSAGGFLERVRDIADGINAVLVFDEITSGFRINAGGAHQVFKIEPDIAVYGKAISNGYPMAAVVGRKEVMDKAQDTFISSTYWTERIGSVAALATIKKYREMDVPARLVETGERITEGWLEAAEKNGLKIQTAGIPPLAKFSFDYDSSDALITLLTQEMLKRGFLARDSVYVSYCHGEKEVKEYLSAVNEVFNMIKGALENNKVSEMLEGPVKHSGFTRLT